MWGLANWRLARGQAIDILRYAPEQEPPSEDIESFIDGAPATIRLMPLQSSRYVLRKTRQATSWLNSYIRCEIEDLRRNFVREGKSFYIAFQEHTQSGDRSVAFRLTTEGRDGHTEWSVAIRRVRFDGNQEHFLCAEY
jgi:hypothetical protein